MKTIPLTQDKIALVDDEDYEWLSRHKWCAHRGKNGEWYAKRNGGGLNVRMHREIMNAPNGTEVDHINGNGLDNRRCNLRVCSHAENSRNQLMHRNNTSGYKGVYWHKKAKKWIAAIGVNGKPRHIGLFEDKIAAARAYDDAAKQHYGEFAKINGV